MCSFMHTVDHSGGASIATNASVEYIHRGNCASSRLERLVSPVREAEATADHFL